MKTELIGKSKIIISNPDGIHKYFAWPSAARLQNGKIAVVCSGFRIGHICPFGKAVIVYSEDEGETYTAPAPVIDTILDDRDAGIAVIGEKDVVVTSFNLDWQCLKTYREWYKGYEEYVDGYVSLISDEDVKKTSASRFRVSHNCGMTFSETYRSPVTSPHGPIELKDGSLLWVGRIYRDDNEHHSETDLAAYKIYLDGRCEFRGALGQTYEGDTPVFSCEPNAIELDDGTILCHLRAHYKCMLGIYQTESKDGGKTWTKPHRITEWQEGAPAHLIKHSSGLLISTYGHRNGIDSGIRVMFSRDNGRTWNAGHSIFETDTGEDLGYPATVELKDGSLLTVFYAHVAKDGPAVIMQQKGFTRNIMNKIAEKNDALDAFIANYCIDHPLSGSVRITLNDKIIYQKFCGKADYENDRELDEKSVFSLYSLSKPFCAIGLMKLFDKGLVDIDTHHGEYLPEMCGFDKRVTVRQMLCHTSGLPDFVQTEGFTDKHPDGSYDKLKEALLQLSCYPMLFEPGTAERYENINFLPLALIIENVSGMSYSEYMEQEVFSPLGMSTAKVDFPWLIVSLRVKGYELINGVRTHVDRCTDYMLGAGDIIGTLDDVYCLNKAIKNKALLKPETWIQVLTPSPLNNMGFGCTVAEWHGMNRIMHNGGYTGFRSLHLQLPDDDFDIIFLFNTGYCDARYDISEKIYDIYYGGMIPDTVKVEMDKGYI